MLTEIWVIDAVYINLLFLRRLTHVLNSKDICHCDQ